MMGGNSCYDESLTQKGVVNYGLYARDHIYSRCLNFPQTDILNESYKAIQLQYTQCLCFDYNDVIENSLYKQQVQLGHVNTMHFKFMHIACLQALMNMGTWFDR